MGSGGKPKDALGKPDLLLLEPHLYGMMAC